MSWLCGSSDPAFRETRCRYERGTSSLEVVVAFTLLSGVLGLATPLVVRHGHLLAECHDYQQALEELSNQMERLTELDANELPTAVDQLTPSPFAAAELPGAKLHGQMEPAEMGTRLTLRLSWDEPGRRERPVCLTAWVFPHAGSATGPMSRSKP